MKRNLLTLLLAALFMLTPATVHAESGESQIIFFEENIDCLATGAETTALEKEIDLPAFKAYITEQAASCPEMIDVSEFEIDSALKSALGSYIFDEIPELFHLQNKWGYSIGGYGMLGHLVFYYTCDAEAYATMLAELRAEAAEMTKGLDSASLTDAEKALILHDRLVMHCEYDYDNLNAGTLPAVSYTAYGALVNQIAVCQGYAEAYDYMLETVGIESLVCESRALNHAWNLVYIDGTASPVDTTWDDPVLDVTGRVGHENFLRSNEGIYATGHTATDYDTPATHGDYAGIADYDLNSAYVLLNGEIYYFEKEGTAAKLMRKSDGKHFLTVNEYWLYDETSYWGGNYSYLCTDGKYLLYNTAGSIIRLDVATNEPLTLYSLDSAAYPGKSIFGFKYEKGNLIFEIGNSPTFDGDTEQRFIIPYSAPSVEGDINGDSELSSTDLILLAQWIAGGVENEAADINGDGEINASDLILLAQLVAA